MLSRSAPQLGQALWSSALSISVEQAGHLIISGGFYHRVYEDCNPCVLTLFSRPGLIPRQPVCYCFLTAPSTGLRAPSVYFPPVKR